MTPIMKRTEKDDAVSPVVGVMLMLVVTIIIAAVVAAFTGGLVGDTKKAPTAVLDVEITHNYNIGMTGYPDNYAPNMIIKHISGDSLKTSDLKITFSWVDASGVVKTNVYAGEKVGNFEGAQYTEDGVGALFLDDGVWGLDDNFGNCTLSAGKVLNTGAKFLKADWEGAGYRHTGSPFMDILLEGEVTATADDSTKVYSDGSMKDVPVGTPITVKIAHIPSGQLIYDKVVTVQ